jgi:hypothetical protein
VQTMPIEDIAGNIIPQQQGYGFFADALNSAMTGLTNWAAGPGHQALMAVAGDLGTFFKSEIDKAFVNDQTGQKGTGGQPIGGVAQWLNNTSDAIGAWKDTTLGPLFQSIGTMLGLAFRDGLKGVIPRQFWGVLGLEGTVASTVGVGGKPGDYAGPGPNPAQYQGTDGKLHQYAPGAAGGYQIPSATGTGYGTNPMTTQAPPTIMGSDNHWNRKPGYGTELPPAHRAIA